jgi:hypothetical protein
MIENGRGQPFAGSDIYGVVYDNFFPEGGTVLYKFQVYRMFLVYILTLDIIEK